MKKLLLVFPIITLLAAGCNSSQQATTQAPVVQNTNVAPTSTPNQTNWATYTSNELGLSFKYPTDLKVYQQDESNILIKAPYANSEHSLVEITMSIKKINPKPETDNEINFRLQGKKILSTETHNGYKILRFEGGSQCYIINNQGTFYVGDSLDTIPWKDIFQKEGVYQTYRSEFDAVRNSIVFN